MANAVGTLSVPANTVIGIVAFAAYKRYYCTAAASTTTTIALPFGRVGGGSAGNDMAIELGTVVVICRCPHRCWW